MRRFLGALLVVAALSGVTLAGASTAGAPVRGIDITGYSVSPATGTLTVKVKWWGWKMYPKRVGKANRPDGGHYHLFVNGNRRAEGTGKSVTAAKLPAAKHWTFYVALANDDHTAVKGAARSATYSEN